MGSASMIHVTAGLGLGKQPIHTCSSPRPRLHEYHEEDGIQYIRDDRLGGTLRRRGSGLILPCR